MTMAAEAGGAADTARTDDALRVPVVALPRLPSSRDLYDRWERHRWSMAELACGQDASAWQRLDALTRSELLTAISELEAGKVAVTRTFSALVDHAPDEDDRVYLCTQLADEGRHVRFFQDYLTGAAGLAPPDRRGGTGREAATAYRDLFEPTLRAATSRVDEPGPVALAWHQALVHSHLITEGVLATTALCTVRGLARHCQLRALERGLANITRDETRHVTYGLVTARKGAAGGYRDAIVETYLVGTELAARAMVAPGRHAVTPLLKAALRQRAAQLTGQWAMARKRVMRQLAMIGLSEHRTTAARVWTRSCERALDEYAELWNTDHPVRRAAA